jgi:hypothetical protein
MNTLEIYFKDAPTLEYKVDSFELDRANKILFFVNNGDEHYIMLDCMTNFIYRKA